MQAQEIDIHRLKLRYRHIRIQQPIRVRRLSDSIAQNGQLCPLVAVADDDEGLILIDGYQRHAALRLLERDMALVIVPDLTEQQALSQLLVQRGDRTWEAIEEAGLIQELHRRFGCSFRRIGQQMGRDPSFVKRRLDLLESLPEKILGQVLGGVVSTWAASRVLVPLARANDKDAEKLSAHLDKLPMSTRQLRTFFEHYRKANRKVRDRMLESPSLFIRSLESASAQADDGPEEKWLRDAKAVCGILYRMQKKTPTVFYPNQEKIQRNTMLSQVGRARRLTKQLQQQIIKRIEDDRSDYRSVDPGIGQKGRQPARNRQEVEDLKKHHPQDIGEPDPSPGTEKGIAIRKPFALDPRPI
jgi:ParB/RepB/Spo0J family partition protein